MNLKSRIINITIDNLHEHPGSICFINPKHPLFHKKVEWLREQYKVGLKIKLLYLEGEKRPKGFIEYVPGEYCWRAIKAAGYMVIHCLWTNGKKYQHQGLGSLLIKEAEKDARRMLGVAVVTSDKSFMATQEIFIKNGYEQVAVSGDEQLLVKKFKKGLLPSIYDGKMELQQHTGLSIVYSRQCPWVARFMEEVKPILKKENLKPEILELKDPAQAQRGPSVYGCFNLIWNNNVLADRYISTTRFLNIIKKVLKN